MRHSLDLLPSRVLWVNMHSFESTAVTLACQREIENQLQMSERTGESSTHSPAPGSSRRLFSVPLAVGNAVDQGLKNPFSRERLLKASPNGKQAYGSPLRAFVTLGVPTSRAERDVGIGVSDSEQML